MTGGRPRITPPPGFAIGRGGRVVLHRDAPPTAAEVRWMWDTTQELRRAAGLPPLEPRRRPARGAR